MAAKASTVVKAIVTLVSAAALLILPPPALTAADPLQPELVVQYSHVDRALNASFSRSGMLALSDGWGRADIWDTRNWTLVREFDAGDPGAGRRYETRGITLSPDGPAFASADSAGRVGLWNVRSGALLRYLPGAVALPVAVVWSSGGSLVAASGETSAVWDAETGRLIREFSSGGDIALSHDGRQIAIAGDNSVTLFDIATGEKLRALTDKSGVWSPVAFSPDGKLVATGGEDPDWEVDWPYDFAPTESAYAHEEKVKLWDARTGKLLRILPGHYSLDGGTRVLQFSSDGRRLFSGGTDHCVVWDVHTGCAIRYLDNAYACAMSPDGRMVFTSGEFLDVYSVSTGKRLARLHPPPLRVDALEFSPDGALLVCVHQYEPYNTAARVWDTQTSRPIRLFQGPGSQFPRVGVLDGGRVYLSGLQGGAIWDLATGELLRSLEGPQEMGFGGLEHKWALMTPDGSKLVTDSGESFHTALKVWNLSTGKLIARIPSRLGGVGSSAFSRDGRYVASIQQHQPPVYKIWSLESGDAVSELADTPDYVSPFIFSNDGLSLAGFVSGQGIVFWDTVSGRQIGRIDSDADAEAVGGLAFSADGSTLALVADDRIDLYDVKAAKRSGSIHTGRGVSSVAFSPDGRTIAAGDDLGRVRMWDACALTLVVTMIGLSEADTRAASEEWIAFWPDGRCQWSDGAAELVRWRLGGWLYPASAFDSWIQARAAAAKCLGCSEADRR